MGKKAKNLHKKPSFTQLTFTNLLLTPLISIFSGARKILIPIGDKNEEIWGYFYKKAKLCNLQHTYLTTCICMTMFFTYPFILMSMHAHMKSLILMKALPLLAAFSIDLALVYLVKQTIESLIEYRLDTLVTKLSSAWCKKIDGNDNIGALSLQVKQVTDPSERINTFCKSFLHLVKNGIKQLFRIFFAAAFLFPRVNLATIGLFVASTKLYYLILNKINRNVSELKQKSKKLDDNYIKLKQQRNDCRDKFAGNHIQYSNHCEKTCSKLKEKEKIDNEKNFYRNIIEFLNNTTEAFIAIIIPILMMIQNKELELGKLEQAKEGFLRIFLGIDPIAKSSHKISDLQGSFEQVKNLDPLIHATTSTKTDDTAYDYYLASINTLKSASFYASILCLTHISIAQAFLQPQQHILEIIFTNTLFSSPFLSLIATYITASFWESSLIKEQKDQEKQHDITQTSHFALTTAFALALFTGLSIPSLLQHPQILYSSLVVFSILASIVSTKYFKYKSQKHNIPQHTATKSITSHPDDLVSIKEIDNGIHIELQSLTFQWDNNPRCQIANAKFSYGNSYVLHGDIGKGKSVTLKTCYHALVYDRMLPTRSRKEQGQDILGTIGFGKKSPHATIQVSKPNRTIPLHITQKNGRTQSIEVPELSQGFEKKLLAYQEHHSHIFGKKAPSDLQKYLYELILTPNDLPDRYHGCPHPNRTSLNETLDEGIRKKHPHITLLDAWPELHNYMVEFIEDPVFQSIDSKVKKAIQNQCLSELTEDKKDNNICTQGLSLADNFAHGKSSGGERGMLNAAIYYSILKLRIDNYNIALMLDEPFKETAGHQSGIIRRFCDAVKSGDDNDTRKPLLMIIAHEYSDKDICTFSHQMQFPAATIIENTNKNLRPDNTTTPSTKKTQAVV